LPDFLILDEPTNHLDVESIEAIEDAIEEYEGTVLLVSHDRALLRELSTRVWAYEGTHLTDYGGTFVEWEQAKKEATLAKRAADSLAADARREQERARGKSNASSEAQSQAARKARRKEVETAERAVKDAERRVAELKRQLADPKLYDGSGVNAKRAGELDKERAAAERALDTAMERWAALDK